MLPATRDKLILFIINRFSMSPDEATSYVLEFPRKASMLYVQDDKFVKRENLKVGRSAELKLKQRKLL